MANKQTAPNFAIHQPSAQQLEKQYSLAVAAQTYANALIDNCPGGTELDTALTALKTSIMWGNFAIVAPGQTLGAAR